VAVTTTNMSTNATSTAVTGGSVTSVANANTAMTNVDAALSAIDSERALYGAAQNRFENVVSTLQVSTENQTAARSRIMDADFAAETANLSRAQILQQAGTAMIAQANQLPQQVLTLLK
jgi:flagellin